MSATGSMSPTFAPTVISRELPQWLCQQLVQGTLPWDNEPTLTYPAFCDRYTLRDSYWLGCFQTPHAAVACFRWDLLWLPDRLFHQVGQADAIYLFLQFAQPLGVTITAACDSASSPPPVIAQSPSPPASVIACVELEPVEEQRVWIAEDVSGGAVTVVFQGDLKCLAMTGHNQLIQL